MTRVSPGPTYCFFPTHCSCSFTYSLLLLHYSPPQPTPTHIWVDFNHERKGGIHSRSGVNQRRWAIPRGVSFLCWKSWAICCPSSGRPGPSESQIHGNAAFARLPAAWCSLGPRSCPHKDHGTCRRRGDFSPGKAELRWKFTGSQARPSSELSTGMRAP